MNKPRLLDLFCKAGGCTKGYQRAGFYVVGVDIEPQPRYVGDEFVQADALDYVAIHGHEFDAIHASPPCQGYSDLRHRTGKVYPMLIGAVRSLLVATGKPYVIENVEGAPLLNPIVLCGSMFDGLRVRRHRLFESSLFMLQPGHNCTHIRVFTHDKRKAHHGLLNQDEAFVQVTGGGNCSVDNARSAMGIDWMSKAELNEAIPPAYTEWIGQHLMQTLMEPTP